MNYNNISLYDIIYYLNEEQAKEVKKDVLYHLYDVGTQKVCFQKKENLFKDFSRYKVKTNNYEIIYRHQLESKWITNLTKLRYPRKAIIEDLYSLLFNNKINDKYQFTKQEIKTLNKVFAIDERNSIYEIKKCLCNHYPLFSKYINIRIPEETVSFKSKNNHFISIVVSEKTSLFLHQKKMYRINDLKKVTLNTIEIENIKNYINDLDNYIVSDRLVTSLISKKDANKLIQYIRNDNFFKTANYYKVSTTKIRSDIYSIINRFIIFFDSQEGIRTIRLLFSNNDNYITIDDLKKEFIRYYEIIIFLLKRDFIYNVYFNKEYNIFTSNCCINDSFIINEYRGYISKEQHTILFNKINKLFVNNNIRLSKDIILKRMESCMRKNKCGYVLGASSLKERIRMCLDLIKWNRKILFLTYNTLFKEEVINKKRFLYKNRLNIENIIRKSDLDNMIIQCENIDEVKEYLINNRYYFSFEEIKCFFNSIKNVAINEEKWYN